MKKNTLLIILIALFSLNCFSQFSKTHYIPPLSNSDSQEPQSQYMYISCPSIIPINFKIIQIGGTTINGTVSRDTPYVYAIGSGFNTQLLISRNNVNSVRSDKGFIVEAEDLVYVSVRLTTTPQNYQAGGIVSKGLAALGTQFRIGAFTNTSAPSTSDNNYTFAAILATENNTTISFSDIKPGVSLINNAGAGNNPSDIILNSGESFVMAVEGPSNANKDGLIGSLISSDKPIVVNCGSIAGSNGNTNNLDLGLDQIVSAERTGSEYIFVKGNGLDIMERPMIVAHEDNTQVFLNGSATPFTTLNAGEYVALDGSQFSANRNLYVNTSKNVFAYQGIGGSTSQANQNMHFLPPLSCQTPKVINNIPFINSVGNDQSFIGTVNIVTETGATLNFTINGIDYTLATLPAGIVSNGPYSVTGNSNFETYIISGFTGNVSVYSTNQIYLSFFGSSGAATYGGYYSGFTFKPEITLQAIDVTSTNCIPNVNLQISTISGFDTFQWYFNGNPIASANSTTYVPTQPGYYYLKASISTCVAFGDLDSDIIPVSYCTEDLDHDNVNNNVDLDNDNDGLTNCTESYGDQNIDISNTNAGIISVGNFTDNFTGVVSTSGTAAAIPFIGNADGSFISRVPPGKQNSVTYTMNFTQPISIGVEYITSGNPIDYLNSEAEYIIRSSVNKTITVLNPSNQLLIDTNYDNIYESGVTQFSSFEIHFRLNSPLPLAAGSGTFQFLTNLSNSISFTHKNLSDTNTNRSSLRFYVTCVPKDSDNDGIPDQIDYDSDNDGILDLIESQGATFVPLTNFDFNNDGIDNAFGTGITAVDSDNDGVSDYLDLDSDNDGIYDLNESGGLQIDADLNGVIDGNSFGVNGLNDGIETTPESGILNYTIANTDGDSLNNYLDLESDSDGCNDVIEAGFTDANNDGLLGPLVPPTVNSNGIVLGGSGYTVPNINYITSAPIAISIQPQDIATCEAQNATFTITTNPVDSYQWQISIDNGVSWNDLNNNVTYSGVTTISLLVSNATPAMNGYKYRVFLNKNGNSCGLYSTSGTLTIYALPVVTTPITLKQCDEDTDGISDFNLTEKNNFISTNFASETFTYFTTSAGAITNDTTVKINNPIVYTSGNGSVWARVENANGCFRIAQINLIVTVTQINSATFHRYFTLCDDEVTGVSTDVDGTSVFDFSSVTNDINALLPPPSTNYTITYFANEADALAETNVINSISNYRNTTVNQHEIYVRIDSTIDNACFGLGPFVTLTVEALPIANPINSTNIIRSCDDDQDGIFNFDTSNLEATLLNGQISKIVTYTDSTGASLPSPLPNPFAVNTNQTITVRVTNTITNATNGPCYDEETIQFIVDDLPEANAIPLGQLTVCDDEENPTDQDGLYDFDTSNIQSNILQGQIGMIVTYTLQDGTILNSLPNPFTTATQDVLVTVTNPINTSCQATTILNFIVNPVPNIDLNTNGLANELVCTNLPTFTVDLDAGVLDTTQINNYTYQWNLDGNPISGATSNILTVNTAGTYTVDVYNSFNCVRTRTIIVTASDIAHIQNINIVDLVDNNTVLITVTGTGDYVYSLDDEFEYQTSNFFENVSIGFHTVFIKDLNGCGTTEQLISVVGAPRYFTPNGDGYNDYWNIRGVNAEFYAKSIIYIFDRYGKLIKQISPVGQGWDGNYNGTLAPSDDYWFTLKLDDGRSAKGHFALKR